MAVKVSERSTGSKSTSGVFSGSLETIPKNNNNVMTEDTQVNERKIKDTARYVKQVGRPLTHRKKYPSEPSSLQNKSLSCGVTTRTQENVFKMGENTFSIHSTDSESGITESLSVSQISLVSSDHQEIRESIAEETRQILQTHVIGSERHKRFKEAKKVLDREGVVFLVSRKGSGLTHLGWDLLSMVKSKEKYNIIEVDEFQICTRSKESVAVLADDAFGLSTLDELSLDKWLRYVNLDRRNRARNVKFIFTVKHHIISQCIDKLVDYRKCIVDLESPRLQLDSDEMLDIMKNIVHQIRDSLKISLTEETSRDKKRKGAKHAELSNQLLSDISENASAIGFPKKVKKFLENRGNINQGLKFFTMPTEADLNEITEMKSSHDHSDHDRFLTLAIIAVYGELKLSELYKIDDKRLEYAKNQSSKTKKKTKRRRAKGQRIEQAVEIPWQIEMINCYAQHCKDSVYKSVQRGIPHLKGVFITDDRKDVFDFTTPCVRHAVLLALGHDFPQHILKFCDLPFFESYVCGDSRLESDETKCVQIDVLNNEVCSEANKWLLTLLDEGNVESFARHKLFRNPTFIQQFFGSFGKNLDQLWDIIRNNSGRCIITCSLDQRSKPRMEGNLSYALLLHKVWNQKRKGNREWTSQKEFEVIKHCCEQGQTEIYFELRGKYSIPVNYECLQLAIKSGTYDIVDDILKTKEKALTDTEKCKSMEHALLAYSKDPSNCRFKVVNVLQKFVSVDYKIKGVDPVIHTAAKTGNSRVIVTLGVFKGDINITSSEGRTIIHEATESNKTAFLKMALKYGADQMKADKDGILPIHLGAIQNKAKVIKILMEADEDVAMATDRYRRQPLHYAAIHSSVETANCLIEQGVDVDACDDKQKTPLHYAAQSGKGTVVHCLLQARANINKPDKELRSPLLLACKHGNVQGVKRILREKDRENLHINDPCAGVYLLHIAAEVGEEKIFKLLIDAGADINEVTLMDNDTALHIAVANGHDKLVYHILQEGNELIERRNKKGEVPLHIAARCGNLSLTRAFLAHGAERSPIDKCCKTPLMLVEEKLSELKGQRNTEIYEDYHKMRLLLQGNKVFLETAV